MKTDNNKSILILSGLILTIALVALATNSTFKTFMLNELGSFDIQALYAVAGIVVSSLAVYIIVNVFVSQQPKAADKRVDYLYQRPTHHRAVIKKTA